MILSLVKKYTWVINVLLIIAIAYVLALIVNDRLKKKIFSPMDIEASGSKQQNPNRYARLNQKQPKKAYYDIILKSNIFGISNSSGGGYSGSGSNDGSAPMTSLNIELIGTWQKANGDSIAIIKNVDTGKANGYRDGDVVDIITDEKVKLLGVDNCKALLDRRSEGTETIECKKEIKLAKLPDSYGSKNVRGKNEKGKDDGIKQVGEDQWEIERKMLDELLDDPTTIMNQARVVPQKDGLRFFGIRPRSVFFKLGLRNGDIVHKINDVELNDVENALGIFGQLKDESEFGIDFTRRGKKRSYAYNVK